MWKYIKSILLLWVTFIFLFAFFLLTQFIQLFWVQDGDLFIVILTTSIVWILFATSTYFTWKYVAKNLKIFGVSIAVLFFLVYGVFYTHISFVPQDNTFLEYIEQYDEEYLLWQAFALIDEEQVREDLQSLSSQERDMYITDILQDIWQISYEHAIYVANNGTLRSSFFYNRGQYLEYQKYKIVEITSNLNHESERYDLGDLDDILPLLVSRENIYRIFGWLDTLVLLKNSLLDIKQEMR